MSKRSTEAVVSAIGAARERARTDPVWFAEQILQLRPLGDEPAVGATGFDWKRTWACDPWQVELMEAVADVERKQLGQPTRFNHDGKNWITVSAPQGPGKTLGIAALAHWFGFCHYPCGIVVTAPKLEHVETRFFGEFHKLRGRAVDGYAELMEVQTKRVYWRSHDPDNHLLIAETGAKPENIQGFRRRNLLVLVDEASGVSETLWPVLFGNMANCELAVLVMISNPTRTSGVFARSHRDRSLRAQYYRLPITLDKANRVDRKWVADMVSQFGADSPVVKVRCYGEFAESNPGQLLSLGWISDARERAFAEDGSLPRLRVSVDVADGGVDMTAITVGRHYESHRRLIRQTVHSFDAATANVDAADAAERAFCAYGGDRLQDDFVVDTVGVGTGVAAQLVSRGYRVVRYKGGSDADNPKLWRNRRVQSYLVLRDALRDGHVSFADDFTDDWSELEAQLCSVQSKPGIERLEDLMSKQDMLAQGIKSPDRADSIAMQFATQRPVMAGQAAQRAAARVAVTESTLLEGLL